RHDLTVDLNLSSRFETTSYGLAFLKRFNALNCEQKIRKLFVSERPQNRPQHGEGTGAMTQSMFHEGTEFAEGAMVLGDEKQGIVTEAALAAEITNDPAMTATFRDRLDFSFRIGKGGSAHVISGTLIVRKRRQFGQKAGIVGGIVPLPTGI